MLPDKLLMKSTSSFVLILSILVAFTSAFGQRLVDKNKGDHNQTKKGLMDGNLVSTIYYNFGEIADWENEPSRSGVWPKGTNHTYVDGVAIIVQAETVAPGGEMIHPLETNYYEFTRFDRSTGVTYGWYALPGYTNPFQSNPAQSTRPQTWPTHWPDRLATWDGFWNGFFGKGKHNADLETYFVMDDNEDRDYLLNYNFHPDADDPDRGGLGMQVRVRGFQWSQVLAEDVIFWLYEITNMSTTDYERTLFAQYVDWGIGGHDNSSNNAGDYDEVLDISFAWSTVPFGSPGNWSPVGLSAYAFLESPGIPDDTRDNDQDGLTDEKRNNAAVNFIETPSQDPFVVNVFQDTTNFRRFYNRAWTPHWDADENGNWRSFTDLDENGIWNEGEPLNDDIGADGSGPFDKGYEGPDADNTEGNGQPDEGEPNFGTLDKDESDQLGLTGFLIFPVHTPYDLDDDEENWRALSSLPTPHGQSLVGVNLANFFSSYLFHMFGRNTYSSITGQFEETGETQRFSMAMIFGIDQKDIFRRKRTVQQIYNANYQFAKPPDKPIAKVIAGNKRVTLYWGNRSELTFDPFFQKFNFEGYRIYRSTEPNFLENKVITDAFGKPIFRKPIAQFDLVNGVRGLHPIAVNGAHFDLGEDTGLRHSYIDTTVQNGQTYYYAVVAYDQGFTTTTVEGVFTGIPPTETTSIIKMNINGELETDINTAVVTPAAPAAGYVAPEIDLEPPLGPGTGTVSISVIDPDSLRNNHVYQLEFEDFSAFHNNPNPSYRLIDYSEKDTLTDLVALTSTDEQTFVFDGIAIDIKNDANVFIDQANTGWVKGQSNYVVQVGFDERFAPAYQSKRVAYPADFEITFTGKGEGDRSFPATGFSRPLPSNIVINNLTEDIKNYQFIFRDVSKDTLFNDGDAIFFASGDSSGKTAKSFSDLRVGWSVTFLKDTTLAETDQHEPQPGDVFKVVTKKPFRTGEFFKFTTTAPSFKRNKAVSDLDNIAVVPNPYVGAASWEPLTTSVGRGERRVFFVNLPTECTIRIYTIAGHLVKTISHRSGLTNGQESWNLVTQDGMDAAFGVYIYHVDTPTLGNKIGKFALIK